jgi:tetratricopeptide (TPR) repeat protein
MKDKLLDIFTEDTVLFFGAGISFYSGIPLVYGSQENQGIIDSILKALDLPQNEINIIMNSNIPFESYIQNLKMGSNILPLLDIFNIDKPNHTHKFMANCAKEEKVKIFVTTNFDCLLEKELNALNIKYQVFTNEKEFLSINWDSDTIKVIKLHGSIKNKNELSVTIEKVANKDNLNGFQQIIEYIFHNGEHKNVLILGYSCSDVFDITPAILKNTNNLPTIFFIQHDNTNSNIYEDVSISNNKNPFKNHIGYRYNLNTDQLLNDISLKQFNYELKIISNNSNNWKNIIYEWNEKVYSSHAIISKIFIDISEFYLAESYLDEAIKYSSDDENLLTFYINLIPALTSIGKYKKANLLAIKAIEMSKNNQNMHTVAMVYLNFAELKFHLDDYNTSLELLLQAEKFISKAKVNEYKNSNSLSSRILAMIGECYVSLGEFSKAQSYLSQAEILSISSGEVYSKSIIYRSFAKIYENNGDFYKSIDYVKKSISFSQKLSHKHFEAASWIELGNYYRKIRDFDNSINANSKALDIANILNLKKLSAIAKGNLGLDYMEIEKFNEAKDSLKYAIDNTDGLLSVTYKINYGMLNNKNNEFVNAISILKNAIEILEQENNYKYKNELRRAYVNLTNSYLKIGELINAKNSAKKSLDLAIELNNLDGEMRARVNLGLALSELNNISDGVNEIQSAYQIACEYYGQDDFTTKHIFNLLNSYKLPSEYAYYIEPCQLCLSRGDFHSCGWCTDTDSSAGNGKVKLPKEDWGYPYHQKAHPDRKYYTSDNVHIPEMNGKNTV